MNIPRCIASTSEGRTGIDPHDEHEDQSGPKCFRNHQYIFFKEACWSPDGTCLLARSTDNSLRTYVVPPSLLDKSKQPHQLNPYSTIESTEPVRAYKCYPGYDLSDPASVLVLSSQRDHPIRLNNALNGSKVASYPLMNPMTEAFISPHSFLFSGTGSNFIAGSDNLIGFFDVSRSGEGPISCLSTGPGKGQGAVMSMKGIVSALAIDEKTGILAAGTFSRHVGLYGGSGKGECVGVFRVEGTDADMQIGGAGITQVSWSEDGRYLYIAERKSDGVMIYDIRKTGQLLGWLVGRNAGTNQRLGVDVVSSQDSTTVWAGGLDGCVRKWTDPHLREGTVQASAEWQGHQDAVSSIVSHHSGSVLASCSGQRHVEDGVVDNALKIWTNG